MVMTGLPTYHFWKFLMKNMIPTNNGLILYCTYIIITGYVFKTAGRCIW